MKRPVAAAAIVLVAAMSSCSSGPPAAKPTPSAHDEAPSCSRTIKPAHSGWLPTTLIASTGQCGLAVVNEDPQASRPHASLSFYQTGPVPVWARESGLSRATTILATGDLVIIGGTSMAGRAHVVAVSVSGKTLWDRDAPGTRVTGLVWVDPVRSRFFVGTDSRVVTSLSTTRGQILQTRRLPFLPTGLGSRAGHVVATGSRSGRVLTLGIPAPGLEVIKTCENTHITGSPQLVIACDPLTGGASTGTVAVALTRGRWSAHEFGASSELAGLDSAGSTVTAIVRLDPATVEIATYHAGVWGRRSIPVPDGSTVGFSVAPSGSRVLLTNATRQTLP